MAGGGGVDYGPPVPGFEVLLAFLMHPVCRSMSVLEGVLVLLDMLLKTVVQHFSEAKVVAAESKGEA